MFIFGVAVVLRFALPSYYVILYNQTHKCAKTLSENYANSVSIILIVALKHC